MTVPGCNLERRHTVPSSCLDCCAGVNQGHTELRVPLEGSVVQRIAPACRQRRRQARACRDRRKRSGDVTIVRRRQQLLVRRRGHVFDIRLQGFMAEHLGAIAAQPGRMRRLGLSLAAAVR